jgi:copper chaperone
MLHRFEVANIKCGGCARSIDKALRADPRVTGVEVDVEKGVVSVQAGDDAREPLRAELLRLGYPEAGSTEGLAALAARGKSFVSCAIGRFGKD